MKEWLYRGMLGFGEAMMEEPVFLGGLVMVILLWLTFNTFMTGKAWERIDKIILRLRMNGMMDWGADE